MADKSSMRGRPTGRIEVQVSSVPGQDQWWQLFERAFREVTKTEEGRALYGDPDRGATLPQAWRASFLIAGIDSMCLAVDSLPEDATEGITRLAKFPREQVVDLLIQAFSKSNAISVYETDGRTGHVVIVLDWDAARSRFAFHDPWPGDSLLTTGNNVVGVAAVKEPDGEWSISRDEMTKVIQAAFLLPSAWADLTGNPSQQPYADLTKSEFFTFFNLREVSTESLGSSTGISLKTGGFQEDVDITVWKNDKELVSSASLRMRESWVIGPPLGVNPFALDIAKSFLVTFAPPQDRDDFSHLAATVWSLRDLEAVRPTLQDPAFAQSVDGQLVSAYIGKSPFMLTLGYCTLEVETEKQDDQPWICMTVSIV